MLGSHGGVLGPIRFAGRSIAIPGGTRAALGALALMLLALASGAAAAQAPTLVIGAVLGLLFVCLLLADLMIGLTAFVIFQFLLVLPFASSQNLTIIKGAGAVLFLTWVITLASESQRRRARGLLTLHPWLASVLVAFLLWGGLSILWAPSSADVAEAWQRYALNLILFAIIFTAVRSPRDLRIVALGVVIGGFIAAVGGMLFVEPSVEGRLGGTVGQSNALASQLVPVAILAAGLAWTSRRQLGRLALTAAALTAVAGMVLTLARLGPLTLACAIAAWLAFGGRWRPRIAAAAAAAAIAGIAIFLFAAPLEQRDRVLTADDGGSGRTSLWTVAGRAVEDRPLLGSGLGNWIEVSPSYLLQPGAVPRSDYIVENPTVVHNVFLELLVEVGVIGFALFAAIVLTCLAAAARAALLFRAIGDRASEGLTRALFAGTIGYLAAAFFISSQYERLLWILLGLCVAAFAAARLERDRRAEDMAPGDPFAPSRVPRRPDR